jgi:hypothetical protein
MREFILAFSGYIFLGVAGLVILSFTFIGNDKEDNATYRIESGNERVYYADTFRMFGKGIMFDDVHGKKIILTGNIDIEYIKNQE